MTELLPLNNTPLPVRLRLEDYLMLDDAGAFSDYRKTELIEGEIFFMNAQHRPHARIKSKLFRAIADVLDTRGNGWEAIVEGSIAMPPYSSPEPDIVVTSAPEGKGLIPLDSVKLVIEVSDATLAFDTTRKAALYAGAGIPEYWIVDINARAVRQMWSPDGETYMENRSSVFGDSIRAATIDAFEVATTAL
jgi:Uma2 family endonuclease